MHIGIGDKSVTGRQTERIHCPRRVHAFVETKHIFHNPVVIVIIADHPADHTVRLTTVHHDGTDTGRVGDNGTAGLFLSHALALHQLIIFLPVFSKTRVTFIVNDFKILIRHNLQSQLFDSHFNHIRAANQDRIRQPHADQFLCRMQHARLFPFGQHNTFAIFACHGENRLHKQGGFVDKLIEVFQIDTEVLNRARRHTGFHRRFCHSRGDFQDKTRIKRFRDNIFTAER